MTLQFPTIAERTLHAFQSATKTTSLATLARKAGAEVERYSFPLVTIYTFDDDTSLVVTGRGKSYRAEARLP